jgi:hypothetical protein
MKKMFTILTLVLCLQMTAMAQDKMPVKESDYSNSSVEMADIMRSNGKIYVLVGIIGIIFAGITVYLISTDRKITRIEKNIHS